MSRIGSLYAGGLKLLGFFTKLGSELLPVLRLFAEHSINLNFLQNFLISDFSSVMPSPGVRVNLRPHLINLSLAVCLTALFVNIMSFGFVVLVAAKVLGFDFGPCTRIRVTSL